MGLLHGIRALDMFATCDVYRSKSVHMQLVTLHIIYIHLPFLFREMWFIIMDAYVGLVRLKHNIIVLV